MKYKIPGWILTILTAAAMILFGYSLAASKLLPTKLVFLIIGLLVVLLLICRILVSTVSRVGKFCVGAVLSVLLTVAMGAGFFYLQNALNTVNKITGTQMQVSHIGVYVRADSSLTSLEELVGKPVGILAAQDRENTDDTLAQIEKNLNATLTKVEYSSMTALAESLLGEQTDAIVLNAALLPVLGETEGFEGFGSQIRELATLRVEKVVQVPVKPSVKPSNGGSEKTEDLDCFVLFLSGVDNEGSISNVSRSDTNILAVVNPATRQILLLSTPRDYYVPLSISNGIPDKLTHAGIYGVDVSMDTLAMLYDVPVDYYFRVNFTGFRDVVDALGGVTVNSEYDFTAVEGTHFNAGSNELNGEQALRFARERYAFAAGDRQRGKNQIEVIKAIIRKAASPAILTNYTSLLSALEGSFQLSMPYDKLASLVRSQLENGGNWNVVSYSVDGFGNSAVPYSMDMEVYVMDPDWETVDHAKDLISRVLNGDILTQE